MLQVDLSTLSGVELKQLLELARARSQQGFAEHLQLELRTRGSRAPVLPSRMGFEPEPEVDVASPPPPRPGRPRAMVMALGSVAVAAVVVGWGLSLPKAQQPREPTVAQAAPTRVMVALAGPTPAEAVQAAAPDPAGDEASELEQIADARAVSPAPGVRTRPAHEPLATAAEPAKHNPCLSLPTPGERLVCGYPTLEKRHRAMQQAYERALAAGADPKALDQAQTEWRQARDGVWDRKQLADLYELRTRQLDAAAKAAAPEPPVS